MGERFQVSIHRQYRLRIHLKKTTPPQSLALRKYQRRSALIRIDFKQVGSMSKRKTPVARGP